MVDLYFFHVFVAPIMADREFLGASKITGSWRIQFVVDARKALDKRDKKNFQPGDRVAFYLDRDGRVVLERASAQSD